MPTTYTEDFTVKTYPLVGYGIFYIDKSSGFYPNFGIDTNGLYVEDLSTTEYSVVAFVPLVRRHRKQGYTATVTFMPSPNDATRDYAYGIVVGSTSVQDKVYTIEYTNIDTSLKIRERDITTGTVTDLSSVQLSATPAVNTDYIIEASIVFDSTTTIVTVSATLKDVNGNVLAQLQNVQIQNVYPAFAVLAGLGGGQTGRIYIKNYTITYDGDVDITMPDLTAIMSPDFMSYDWVGAPMLVFWQGNDGQWYSYNPSDGCIYVAVRWHGEVSGTGDKIDMYKICGDPRNPASWQYVKTILTRDQLGWNLLEECNLLVRNDGTYIAFVAGGITNYAVHRLTSTDGGTTWTDEGVIINGKHNKIWVEPDGTIYMTWWDMTNTIVHISKSTDLGVTWVEIGQLQNYQLATIFKLNNKFYLLASVTGNTNNLTYIEHKLDLYETVDFTNFTFVKNIYNAFTDAVFTVYRNMGGYSEAINYNGSIIVIFEGTWVDRDIDDDFNDQIERHIMVLNDPVVYEQLPIPQLSITNPFTRIFVGKTSIVLGLVYTKRRSTQTLRVELTEANNAWSTWVDIDVLSQSIDTSEMYLANLATNISAPQNVIDISSFTPEAVIDVSAGNTYTVTGKLAYIVAKQDSSIQVCTNSTVYTPKCTSYSLLANQAIAIISDAQTGYDVYINIATGAVTIYIYAIPTLTTKSATLTITEYDDLGNVLAQGSITLTIAEFDITGTPQQVVTSDVQLVAVIGVV